MATRRGRRVHLPGQQPYLLSTLGSQVDGLCTESYTQGKEAENPSGWSKSLPMRKAQTKTQSLALTQAEATFSRAIARN